MHLEKVEIPTVLSKAEISTNEQQWRKPTARIRAKIRAIVRRQQLSKLRSDAGLNLVERVRYFYTLETEGGQQMQHLCREYTLPRNEEGIRVRGWIRSKTRICPVLNMKVCCRDEQKSVEVKFLLYFKTTPLSWVRIVNGIGQLRDRIDGDRERREHSFGRNPLLE